ncbi:MAG: coproporphyrinogen III oxidase family protein [Spirochaetaceae bacterium]|jgi:oxygen-independent coproporphyrinogen-3 oxidase|nr:coproporphyrinogen III oxidase family protein [Spirochaetaceae bacterium]
MRRKNAAGRTTVFTERFRSHHDAEGGLEALLGNKGGGMGRLLKMKSWSSVEKKLAESPKDLPRGVYIHVPYCDRICSFCNLNRTERGSADLDAYAAYLSDEIKTFGAYPYIRERPFGTVYFGGGTPTILSTEQLSRILNALHDHIPLTDDCEISVETTQHNLGVKKALALAARGVNRFSVGIQTFSGRGRKVLGRTYDSEKAIDALKELRAAFTGVLGIDIIYSYPGQSLEELSEDAELCLSLGIDSVSFYSLMIHKGSALSHSIAHNQIQFERDIAWDRERHHLFYKKLTDGGFTLLELSKLVRPGRDAYRYIHIQYENGELLPLGSGAGGNLAGFRMYSMAPGRRFVSPVDKRHERYYRMLGELQFGLYNAAKMAEGLSGGTENAIREKIDELHSLGFLDPVPGSSNYTLSPDGVFWGNNIAVEVLGAAIHAAKKEKKVYG